MNHFRLSRLRQAVRFDGVWWRKFAYLGCVYGPEWWKRYSPPGFAAAFFLVVGQNRRGAIANMRRILGRDDWRATVGALRTFIEFSHCITETTEHYGPRPAPIAFDLPERDLLAESLAEGRGVIALTGHFGNWEIAARTMSKYGRPVNIVMAREMNATTQEYVRRAREQAGIRIIYSDTSVFSSLNMIRALRQNEIVAIQMDRMLGTGGGRLIPFFGHPAYFPSGPFQLARLSGAPLVPVFTPRIGVRHYAIRLAGRFDLGRESRDPVVLDRTIGEVAQAFEAAIREFPHQWFQFAPFWPESPAEPQVNRAGEEEPPPLRARR